MNTQRAKERPGVYDDRAHSGGILSKYTLLCVVFVLACPNVNESTGDDSAGGQEAPNTLIEADAGVVPLTNLEDAGIVLLVDAGTSEEALMNLDAGTSEEPGASDEDVVSICVDIEAPDGGDENGIGLVQVQKEAPDITVTVTLFNVNCGITEFNLLMEETESNTVLKTTVSPINLTDDTPLTRCNCDMDLMATYVDEDNSLSSVTAYFYSEVVLDNVDAIPENGFIGEVALP